MNNQTLKKRIENYEFQPEVYIYPTPRMYKHIKEPNKKFNLEKIEFTDKINLYIHIPFCKQICSFCGYLKMIDQNNSIQDTYVKAIIKEIEMYKTILKNKTISTLHFGGGTPSLLSTSNLEKIITTIKKINPKLLETSKEISIEATPESVEENKFRAYKKLGINRVSMGVQTLNNTEIKLSKRNNLAQVTINAINILKKIGVSNIVADIMIGIENQTIESFKKTINELIELKVDTVELYALGLMSNSILAKKINHNINSKIQNNLMSNKDIYECYTIGRELFLNSGYNQDCHNRYIIPNRGSFFQEDNVWKGESLIGFGSGVRSYATNTHYRNTYNQTSPKNAINKYIQKIMNNELAVEEIINLNKNERMRKYIIGNLESLNTKEFQNKFNISFEDKFPIIYKQLIELKLAINNNTNNLELTTYGLNFRDLICREFFSEKVKIAEEMYRPK